MEVKMEACPLTFSYITYLLQDKYLDPYMCENEIAQLAGLRSKAEHAGDSQAPQTLRAFYCVEVAFYVMGGKALQNSGCIPEADEMPQLKTERSWQGLTSIIEKAEEHKGDVLGSSMELAFEMKHTWGSTQANQIARANAVSASSVFDHCISMAEHIRPQLKTFKHLGKIGHLFATVCLVSRTDPKSIVRHASNLLFITEGNAIRGWDWNK
jgi:hypothetical protein